MRHGVRQPQPAVQAHPADRARCVCMIQMKTTCSYADLLLRIPRDAQRCLLGGGEAAQVH
eukprot:scaffold49997_cov59-Phaeocystis_antarctica.AAC.5